MVVQEVGGVMWGWDSGGGEPDWSYGFITPKAKDPLLFLVKQCRIALHGYDKQKEASA